MNALTVCGDSGERVRLTTCKVMDGRLFIESFHPCVNVSGPLRSGFSPGCSLVSVEAAAEGIFSDRVKCWGLLRRSSEHGVSSPGPTHTHTCTLPYHPTATPGGVPVQTIHVSSPHWRWMELSSSESVPEVCVGGVGGVWGGGGPGVDTDVERDGRF